MTLESLSPQDHSDLIAEVGRFTTTHVAPLVQHPELSIAPEQIAVVTEAAARLGLLDQAKDGIALWGSRPGLTSFSVAALRRIAAVDAGVAFHLHRLALISRLRRTLSRTGARSDALAGALSLQGHWGFGRQALARLLAGRPLNDADREQLLDYFDTTRHERVVLGDCGEGILVAGFDGTAITWHEALFPDCGVHHQPHSHGLDAVPTCTIQLTKAPEPGARSTSLYAEALTLDSLGLMAITAGLVDNASAKASQYASMRWQGGGLIKDHPAVQQMLAHLTSARQHATHALAALTTEGPSAEGPAATETATTVRDRLPAAASRFAEVATARASYHHISCHAVNQAMQVFGGIGYMRDLGIERLVRDANCLRVLTGTPNELELFVATWENP